MKRMILSLFLGMSFCSFAFSQSLQVAWDKTTVLIFDSPIQSVDRGSRYLLSEQDDFALNVLKLKAGNKELPNTNLHVLTQDGEIHSFEVSFSEDPKLTTLDFRKYPSQKKAISTYGFDPEDFEQLAEYLKEDNGKLLKKTFRYDVHFWLRGIYFRQGLLFFDLGAKNNSNIPFKVVGPIAKVRDVKSSKLNSSREEFLIPWRQIGSDGESQVLTLGNSESLLMAFPAFTISNRKRLIFYLQEENGDRELQLSLKGRKLLKAIPLPMFHTKPTITHGPGEL